MIGNDIVDLRAASGENNWRRKGFLGKVFSFSEIKLIAGSENKNQTLWLLWSMKEAAYKAHQRKHNLQRRLNWKIQQCFLLERNATEVSGIVQIEEEQYFTFSSLAREVIHTIAMNQKEIAYKKSLYYKPKAFSKRKFLEEVCELMGIHTPSLTVKKSTHGIPFLFQYKEPLPIAFSFSDHGKFSGFCISLMKS